MLKQEFFKAKQTQQVRPLRLLPASGMSGRGLLAAGESLMKVQRCY